MCPVVQKLCNDIQDCRSCRYALCDTTEHIERYTKCFLLILFLCIYIAKEQRTCIQHFKPIPCMFCDVVLHSHLFILLVYYYFLSFWSLLQELIKYLVCKGCLCDFIAQKICFVCRNARLCTLWLQVQVVLFLHAQQLCAGAMRCYGQGGVGGRQQHEKCREQMEDDNNNELHQIRLEVFRTCLI